MPSVLWCCWLGGRKGIRSVKTEWWGAGMVICLERGADLNIAQLMPLPLTVSCYSKIQIGFTFWYWLTRVVPDKGPLNGCVCVSSCARDVLEFESKFKCCWNSVILGNSEIWWIYRLVYVELGLAFIIHRCPLFVLAGVNKCTLNGYLSMSV